MAKALQYGKRNTLLQGPFQGVFSTNDPFDAKPQFLVDAKNVRVPAPGNTSGIYARPQFRVLDGGDPVYHPGTPFRTQAIYTHTMLDGSTINLLVIGGKLFRVSPDEATFTDVTPVGVTIDPGVNTRVFFASLIGRLVVTDGVYRPWEATNLTSTPITGTYIDYDGMGVSWTAYGAPAVYQGSVFFILNQVNGISRRADISWSDSGNPTLGYQQPTFDNNWTLSQNEAGILYAIKATNVALYYFRESSIGSASGQDTASLASTATDDAIAFNIGAQASQTIQKFGDGFFFTDALGRPNWYEPGTAPNPIWQQMRLFVDDASTNTPTTTQIVCTAVVEPTYNLYCAAIWSPDASSMASPFDIHIFDAQTRLYQGHWSVSNDLGVECLGTWLDSAGRATLIAATTGGYIWALSPLSLPIAVLMEEDGATVIVEEDGATVLSTEGGDTIWEDDLAAQETYIMTDFFAFEENTVCNVDMATIITGTNIPVTVSVITAAETLTVQASPAPLASANGTYRCVVGCDAFGRGPQLKVEPSNYDAQFICQRVSVVLIPSQANYDEI